MKIAIKNARIFDPATGRNGEKGELFVEGGRIAQSIDSADLEIDASGRILMAGAIDVAGHIGSYGLNFFRTLGLAGSLRDVAACYVRLGYTLVNEIFATVETAAYNHHELSALPWVDTSLTLSLPLYDLENYIRSGEVEKCARVLAALGSVVKCIGFRIFESELSYEQEIYRHRNIQAEKIFDFFAGVAEVLNTRFFVHPDIPALDIVSEHPESYHLLFLTDHLKRGVKENLKKILAGGMSADTGFLPKDRFVSIRNKSAESPQYLSRFDVGLTHPVYYAISESEGFGYNDELFEIIRENKVGKIAFTTMLPWKDLAENYASLWARIAAAFGFSLLSGMTRNIPAQLLGIPDRGNLNAGSRADIAIYDIEEVTDENNMKDAFSSCWCLLKNGEVLISEGRLVAHEERKTTWYRDFPGADATAALKILAQSSFRPENLIITEQIAGCLEAVA